MGGLKEPISSKGLELSNGMQKTVRQKDRWWRRIKIDRWDKAISRVGAV